MLKQVHVAYESLLPVSGKLHIISEIACYYFQIIEKCFTHILSPDPIICGIFSHYLAIFFILCHNCQHLEHFGTLKFTNQMMNGESFYSYSTDM